MKLHSILLVGDDLASLVQLKSRVPDQYEAVYTVGGTAGLEMLDRIPFFLVILNTLSLPDMDAIEFLQILRHRFPHTVRVVTSNSQDINRIIAAHEEGDCFRFLRKPCTDLTLHETIRRSLIYRAFSLSHQEPVAMLQDLCGERDDIIASSIDCLLGMLSMVSPVAYSRASRISTIVKNLTVLLDLPRQKDYTRAGLLSQLGCITIPAGGLEKMYEGGSLNYPERKALEKYLGISHDLTARIQGLEGVAEIIAKSIPPFDGPPMPPPPAPPQPADGEETPEIEPYDPYTPEHLAYLGKPADRDPILMGGDILKVAIAVEDGLGSGFSQQDIVNRLKKQVADHNPLVVSKVHLLELPKPRKRILEVSIADLTKWMTFEDEVHAKGGILLARKGQKINPHMQELFGKYYESGNMPETVKVSIPHYKD